MNSRATIKTKSISIWILVIISILLGALYISLSISATEKNHIIELRDNGFYPQELTIQRGETVTFATRRNKPFWPASNLHPSHTIYPEFDPKKPIGATESWSFQFMKAGDWKYHDHLAPIYKGEIVVLEKIDR